MREFEKKKKHNQFFVAGVTKNKRIIGFIEEKNVYVGFLIALSMFPILPVNVVI